MPSRSDELSSSWVKPLSPRPAQEDDRRAGLAIRSVSPQRLWYLLGDWGRGPGGPRQSESGAPQKNARRGFAERWLLQTLKRDFPGLVRVEIVDAGRTRFDGESEHVTRERGVECWGPAELLDGVRNFLDRTVSASPRVIVIWFGLLTREQSEKDSLRTAPAVTVGRQNMVARIWGELKEAARTGKTQASILAAPSLSVLNAQEATISTITEVAYVKDFDVIPRDGSVLIDPVLGKIDEGLTITCCPVLHPPLPRVEDVRLDVSIRLDWSVLERPIKTFSFRPEGYDSDVTIQMPALHTAEWSSDQISLEPGDGGFIVEGIPIPHPDRPCEQATLDLYCQIKVRTFEPEAELSGGQVMGFDPRTKQLFVLWPEYQESTSEVGEDLSVYRKDEKVGVARFEQTHGDLIILRLVEGRALEGDRVVRE